MSRIYASTEKGETYQRRHESGKMEKIGARFELVTLVRLERRIGTGFWKRLECEAEKYKHFLHVIESS